MIQAEFLNQRYTNYKSSQRLFNSIIYFLTCNLTQPTQTMQEIIIVCEFYIFSGIGLIGNLGSTEQKTLYIHVDWSEIIVTFIPASLRKIILIKNTENKCTGFFFFNN
jgi:hypothetical protein